MKKPIFILPFDHRSTFAKKLMGYEYPTTAEQAEEVKKMKAVVFDGFLEAREKEPSLKDHQAILVDIEFGEEIIERCKKLGIPFALSTEKSGQEVFTFEYGDSFGETLTKHLPTYAKALLRYDHRKKEDNVIQRQRLKMLSDYCERNQMGLMIEPLMKADNPLVDQIVTCMKEILADGIKPTLWKIEGLDSLDEWEQVKAVTDIDVIVLGRGENKAAVEHWIEIGAKSDYVDGFAIGRTIFFNALEQLRDAKIEREEAVQMIAKNYLHFSHLWMRTML